MPSGREDRLQNRRKSKHEWKKTDCQAAGKTDSKAEGKAGMNVREQIAERQGRQTPKPGERQA